MVFIHDKNDRGGKSSNWSGNKNPYCVIGKNPIHSLERKPNDPRFEGKGKLSQNNFLGSFESMLSRGKKPQNILEMK